jgi:hypothetical protein
MVTGLVPVLQREKAKVGPKPLPSANKNESKKFAGRIYQLGRRRRETRFQARAVFRFADAGMGMRNRRHSLDSACKKWGVPGKLDHKPTGRVTLKEINYCRQDVRATVGLLNAMKAEYDRYPIELQPEKVYSPASIAKAYLTSMSRKVDSGRVIGKCAGWHSCWHGGMLPTAKNRNMAKINPFATKTSDYAHEPLNEIAKVFFRLSLSADSSISTRCLSKSLTASQPHDSLRTCSVRARSVA